MAFIGKKPTAAPLTSSDVADGIITNAKLAQDIISGDTALTSTPADTDELLLSDAGTLKKIDYNVMAGITVADQWRLTTSFTGGVQPIATNLEQIDTSGQGTIGSAMTQSSGIFTFPSTGIWLVFYNFKVNTGSGTTATIDGLCTHNLMVTVNNSDYNSFARGNAGLHDPASNVIENSSCISTLVDVTDVANVKVRFECDSINNTTTVMGDSAYNRTFFTFLRLGAT